MLEFGIDDSRSVESDEASSPLSEGPLEDDVDVNFETASSLVLRNPDLLQMILAKLKEHHANTVFPEHEEDPFPPLRLVSTAFNHAVLNMPHPSPIYLNMNQAFPYACGGPEQCIYIGPVSENDIPTVTPELTHNVTAKANGERKCQCPTEAWLGYDEYQTLNNTTTFLNFCSVYGANIRVLDLVVSTLTKFMIRRFCTALDTGCPNLKEFRLDIHKWARNLTLSGDPICFKRKEFLTSITVVEGSYEPEESKEVCFVIHNLLDSLITAAPNLENIDYNGHTYFDLKGHNRIKSIRAYMEPGVPPNAHVGLMRMLTSVASRLNSLSLVMYHGHLRYESDGEDDDSLFVELFDDFRLVPMPNLTKLNIEFRLDYNFGRTLAACVFSPETKRLQSLKILSSDQGSLKKFCLLIRDNFPGYRNDSVANLWICGSDVHIPHLHHLYSAFSNLKTLRCRLTAEQPPQGAANLWETFNGLSLWLRLEKVVIRLNISFHLYEFRSVLERLDPEFWRRGSIRELTLHLGDPWSFIHPAYHINHPFDKCTLNDVFLSFKGMEKVTFVNFVMPAGLMQSVVKFIEQNAIPIEFVDRNINDRD